MNTHFKQNVFKCRYIYNILNWFVCAPRIMNIACNLAKMPNYIRAKSPFVWWSVYLLLILEYYFDYGNLTCMRFGMLIVHACILSTWTYVHLGSGERTSMCLRKHQRNVRIFINSFFIRCSSNVLCLGNVNLHRKQWWINKQNSQPYSLSPFSVKFDEPIENICLVVNGNLCWQWVNTFFFVYN